MKIQHNIAALNTHRNLNLNNKNINKTLEKLSSGYKINRAGDDAAGLAISEKMRGQIRGLNMAGKNIQDGISLIQTAESAMEEIHAMLQRIRELTVQSANDTNTDEDRDKIAQEVEALLEEINSISERTEFNGMKILRGGGTIAPPGTGGGGGGSVQGAPLTGQALIDARKEFVGKMVESALETSEDYIRNYYGIDARDGAEITVKFTNESPGGAVAWVSSWMETTNGTGVKFELVFDEADVFTDEDLWIDVDRVVAHEMVHAMMSASGMNFYSMPKWFKEGTAEYLPGAKERLTQSVNMIGADKLVNMLDSTGGGSHFYSAAYAGTMFLDAKLRSEGKTMKDLFATLTPPSNATTPMGSTVPTKGPTVDEALRTIFGANYGEAQFKADFKANGAAFINDVITKGGIGSISEVNGISAGMLSFGSSQTNEGFILDSGNPVDEGDGFKYIWDSSTPYSDVYSTPYMAINRTIANNGEMKLHLGANSGQNLTVIMPTVTYESLGLNELDTKHLPDYSLTLLDGAIQALSSERSKLGAIQNRLEHAYESTMNTAENLTTAESRIRDTDMAKEMMSFTKQNILMQAAQSMLGQANQQPHGVMQLLN